MRAEMQKSMQKDAAVFRTGESLGEGRRRISAVFGSFRDADEQFLVKRGEPAFHATQTQRTLARDGPV